MSYYAERYVLHTCPHPEVKGSVRLLFLIIAHHVRQGQGEHLSRRLSLAQLARMMREDESTVRRCRDVLVELGEIAVVGGGRGKRFARFSMRQLGGPVLLDVPMERVGRSGNLPDVQPDKGRASCPTIARRDYVRTDLLLRRRSATADPGAAAARIEPTHVFFDWFREEYFRQLGARYSKSADVGARIIDRQLGLGRSVEDLQALAGLLFTITDDGVRGSDRNFIANSDRSLNIFETAADRLELCLRGRLDLGVARPLGDTSADRIWEQARGRLREYVDPETLETIATWPRRDDGRKVWMSAPSWEVYDSLISETLKVQLRATFAAVGRELAFDIYGTSPAAAEAMG